MEQLLITSRRYLTRFAALVVLGLALALVTGVSPAAASGTSITIAPKATIAAGFSGFRIGIQVTAQCSGGTGLIVMQVSQTAAQANSGFAASGSGSENVKCDGQSHKIALTVFAFVGPTGFSNGYATANATLTAPSGNASDTRTISIVSA
jgi:hypothetical protein